MHKSTIIICLLVILPLLAYAGNIGKDEEEEAGSSKKFDVKGDKPADLKKHAFYAIPENQTEEEWHEEQYRKFQEKEYNAFQKQQFKDFEMWRFQQWQMQKFQMAQAKKHEELQKEHAKFVQSQQIDMKAELEKHEKWLQALLANEKQRKKLLKQIKKREEKEAAKGDL